ncbi:MAG: hypothetical protein JWQ23_28 [Herminiimonas sp.]|nr:hypothetical protein [Herminiimonas sp.]
MLKTTLSAVIITVAGLGLTACDVKKTQEGNVTVPKYEVEKKQAGDVTVPKYEVTPPDVKVGTTEKTIDVPTIKKEEKTIEVPTVQVTPAKDK